MSTQARGAGWSLYSKRKRIWKSRTDEGWWSVSGMSSDAARSHLQRAPLYRLEPDWLIMVFAETPVTAHLMHLFVAPPDFPLIGGGSYSCVACWNLPYSDCAPSSSSDALLLHAARNSSLKKTTIHSLSNHGGGGMEGKHCIGSLLKWCSCKFILHFVANQHQEGRASIYFSCVWKLCPITEEWMHMWWTTDLICFLILHITHVFFPLPSSPLLCSALLSFPLLSCWALIHPLSSLLPSFWLSDLSCGSRGLICSPKLQDCARAKAGTHSTHSDTHFSPPPVPSVYCRLCSNWNQSHVGIRPELV